MEIGNSSYLDNLVFLLISDDVVVVLINFSLVSVVLQEGKERRDREIERRDREMERGEKDRGTERWREERWREGKRIEGQRDGERRGGEGDREEGKMERGEKDRGTERWREEMGRGGQGGGKVVPSIYIYTAFQLQVYNMYRR